MIHSLMTRKVAPIMFPRGFVAKRVMNPGVKDDVVDRYVRGRFYGGGRGETEFLLWILVYANYLREAV